MLLLAVFLVVQAPVDSVALVTRDIPSFWRAYDLAAGKDSAERTRIFRTVHLQPGSPGLRDWMRVRLMNRDTVRARMIASGWTTARLDSLSRDSLERASTPFAEQSAAEELLHALRAYPRYYAAVRARTLAVDTNSAIRQGIRQGLAKLAELPAWAEKGFPTHRFESLVGLVVHEAVHTQQKSMPPGQHDTLLRHALGEGIADFLSELAVGPWAANTPRQIYGRAHEHDVWVDFQDEMEM